MGATFRHRALFVLLLVAAGKLTGLARDAATGFYFGVSPTTEAYFLAAGIAAVVYIGVYSAIPLVIIPLQNELRGDAATETARSRLSDASTVTLLASAFLTVALLLFAKPLLVFAGGSSVEVVAEGRVYLSLMALTFVPSTAVGIANALQAIHGRVGPSFLVPVVNNLVFIAGLALFAATGSLSRVLVGSLTGWIALAAWNVKVLPARQPFPIPHRLSLASARAIWTRFAPTSLALYLDQASLFAAIVLAGQLDGLHVSIWSYATKIGLLVTSVFTVVVSTTLFPRIARLVSEPGQASLSRVLESTISLLVVLSLPATAFISLFSGPLVDTLLLRGSMTATRASEVASVLSLLVVSLPLALAREVLTRTLLAFGDTARVLRYSAFALLATAGLGFVLQKAYGLAGVASAVVLTTFMHAGFCYRAVTARLSGYSLAAPLRVSMHALVALAAAIALGAVMRERTTVPWWVIALPFSLTYLSLVTLLGSSPVRLLRLTSAPR